MDQPNGNSGGEEQVSLFNEESESNTNDAEIFLDNVISECTSQAPDSEAVALNCFQDPHSEYETDDSETDSKSEEESESNVELSEEVGEDTVQEESPDVEPANTKSENCCCELKVNYSGLTSRQKLELEEFLTRLVNQHAEARFRTHSGSVGYLWFAEEGSSAPLVMQQDSSPPLPALSSKKEYLYQTFHPDPLQHIDVEVDVYASQHRCFNCGALDHALTDCPRAIDHQAITSNRRAWQELRGAQAKNRGIRYFVAEDKRTLREECAHYVPGQLSDDLATALGLKEGELPPYIIRMQQFGYPPGYFGYKDDVFPAIDATPAENSLAEANAVQEEGEDGEEKEDGEVMEGEEEGEVVEPSGSAPQTPVKTTDSSNPLALLNRVANIKGDLLAIFETPDQFERHSALKKQKEEKSEEEERIREQTLKKEPLFLIPGLNASADRTPEPLCVPVWNGHTTAQYFLYPHLRSPTGGSYYSLTRAHYARANGLNLPPHALAQPCEPGKSLGLKVSRSRKEESDAGARTAAASRKEARRGEKQANDYRRYEKTNTPEKYEERGRDRDRDREIERKREEDREYERERDRERERELRERERDRELRERERDRELRERERARGRDDYRDFERRRDMYFGEQYGDDVSYEHRYSKRERDDRLDYGGRERERERDWHDSPRHRPERGEDWEQYDANYRRPDRPERDHHVERGRRHGRHSLNPRDDVEMETSPSDLPHTAQLIREVNQLLRPNAVPTPSPLLRDHDREYDLDPGRRQLPPAAFSPALLPSRLPQQRPAVSHPFSRPPSPHHLRYPAAEWPSASPARPPFERPSRFSPGPDRPYAEDDNDYGYTGSFRSRRVFLASS